MASEDDGKPMGSVRQQVCRWCLWVPVLAGGGWLGHWLGIPVGWMLGAVVSGMALRLASAPPDGLQGGGTRAGQWLIGIITGAAFSFDTLSSASSFLPLLIGLVVVTGGLCLMNGYLLQRWAGVSAPVAFLGSLPGAAAAVIGLAASLRVNVLLVVTLMYVRIVLVILLVPLALSLFGGPPVAVAGVREHLSPPLALSVLSLLLAIGVASLGRRIKMPSADFLGPFMLFIVLKVVWPEAQLGLPKPCFSLGLLLLGAAVGCRFDLRAIRTLWRPVLIQVGLVCGLLIACMAAGYLFHVLTDVDLITSVLGTTPGGKEAMIALSMALGGNVELVVVMQTVRWMLIMFLGPALALRVAGTGRKST